MHPGQRRVAHLVGHPARPDRAGQHVGVHAVRVRGQVHDELGGQREPVRLERAGRLHGDLAEQADLDRHGRVGARCAAGAAPAGDRAASGTSAPAAAPRNSLTTAAYCSGGSSCASRSKPSVGAQPPLRRQVPGPGGAADVARDHVADPHPVPAPGQHEQPLRLGLRRRHAHDQVVRRPHGRVGGLSDRPVSTESMPADAIAPRDLGGAPLQLGQGLVEGADNLDPFGRNLGESVAETDERDPHLVGPPVRHQLDGERGQRRLYHLARAAHGDQAVGHLQVHQDPARLVGAEGHQARVRRHGGRCHRAASRPRRGRRSPRTAAATPGRRRPPATGAAGSGRAGRPTGPGSPAQVGREHGRRRLAGRVELPAQVPQAGVEHRTAGSSAPSRMAFSASAASGRARRSGGRTPAATAAPAACGRARPAPRPPAARRRTARRASPGPASRRGRGGRDSMIPNGPGRRPDRRAAGVPRRSALARVPGQAELARQLGRDRLDAGAVRVLGHQQRPAWPIRLAMVSLDPSCCTWSGVQLEDLPVAAAVAEVVVRGLPQRLVVPADRRIDRVHLVGVRRVVVRLRRLGRGEPGRRDGDRGRHLGGRQPGPALAGRTTELSKLRNEIARRQQVLAAQGLRRARRAAGGDLGRGPASLDAPAARLVGGVRTPPSASTTWDGWSRACSRCSARAARSGCARSSPPTGRRCSVRSAPCSPTG